MNLKAGSWLLCLLSFYGMRINSWMYVHAFLSVCSQLSNSFHAYHMSHVLYWCTFFASVLLLLVIVWPLGWSSAEIFHKKDHQFLVAFTSKLLNAIFTKWLNFWIPWYTEREVFTIYYLIPYFANTTLRFAYLFQKAPAVVMKVCFIFSVYCTFAASWTA